MYALHSYIYIHLCVHTLLGEKWCNLHDQEVGFQKKSSDLAGFLAGQDGKLLFPPAISSWTDSYRSQRLYRGSMKRSPAPLGSRPASKAIDHAIQ